MASQTITERGVASRPQNPTRTGYNFDNWYTDAARTQAYNFATPVTANLTLYAKWSAATQTVTFDYNNGTPSQSQQVNYNTPITRPATPARADYRFDNWYADAALTMPYDFSAPVTSDITIYAKWIRQYTVTFATNGGSNVPSQTLDEGRLAVIPSVPNRAGYKFENWYSDAALTQLYDFNRAITSEATLYAKWNQNTYTAVGVSDSSIIPDASLTASGFWAGGEASKGRLNDPGNGWGVNTNNANQWWQVDLGAPMEIGKLAIQSRVVAPDRWISTFKILYGDTPTALREYNGGEILTGNDALGQIKEIELIPFTARYVRINPITYATYPVGKFEFYKVN